MASRVRLILVGLVLILGVGAVYARLVHGAVETLPSRLSDQDFWKLSEDISEPNGFFQSDNLLSNEIWLQYVIPELQKRTLRASGSGGVYLGVGPEQNFTYIAAIKPKMVFLPDIRRGNMELQLMYKAIFELSSNRADFVSMLFCKTRPDGLNEQSTARDIFGAFDQVATGPDALYDRNLKAIDDELTAKQHLPLSKDDLDGIEYVYDKFYTYGPQINYGSSQGNGFRGRGGFTTYEALMEATDAAGVDRSYLATEDNFKVLKDLEDRNMMVPVVGDLSGPKAVRGIAKYLKDHGAAVSAFYLSNVEQYLQRNGTTNKFLCNVAALPLDDQSTFIRSMNGGGPVTAFGSFGGRGGLMSYLGSMKDDAKRCSSTSFR